MPILAADYPVPGYIQCHERKPINAREYWQWRWIDGKLCWFPGRGYKSKVELRWPLRSSPRPAEGGGGSNIPQSQGQEPPPTPMLLEGSFEDRWLGLGECHTNDQVWDCRR